MTVITRSRWVPRIDWSRVAATYRSFFRAWARAHEPVSKVEVGEHTADTADAPVRVFHPPGTFRLLTPMEEAALGGRRGLR